MKPLNIVKHSERIVEHRCDSAEVPPDVEVAWLRPADVLSRYLGESEERLRKAFAELQRLGRLSNQSSTRVIMYVCNYVWMGGWVGGMVCMRACVHACMQAQSAGSFVKRNSRRALALASANTARARGISKTRRVPLHDWELPELFFYIPGRRLHAVSECMPPWAVLGTRCTIADRALVGRFECGGRQRGGALELAQRCPLTSES